MLARKQLSGSGGRSTRVSALTAPRDRDQPQQAGTEQPNGGRDRHWDVRARRRAEREDHVGDNGASGGAGECQRPRRRCVDEGVVRIIISDRAIGVGVRSRSDNQRGGAGSGAGQRIQVITIPGSVGQQPLRIADKRRCVVAYRDQISGGCLETPPPVTPLAVKKMSLMA